MGLPVWVRTIKAKAVLAPSGKSFTADFTYEDYDEAGNKLFGGTGIMEAERLEILPLEEAPPPPTGLG